MTAVETSKRYFGPGQAQPCLRPSTLFCARHECQVKGQCAFPLSDDRAGAGGKVQP